MSDQLAAAPAAPAPAVVEAPVAPVEALVTPDAPKHGSFKEFEQSIGKRSASNPDLIPAPELAAGQKRDPATGKFVADAAAATSPDAAVPATPEPAAPAPEFVKIPIPEGHPLRHRTDHLLVPKEHEEYGRWTVNEAVRREQLEASRQRETEAVKKAAELEAESKFWQEHAANLFGPEFRQLYEDIKDKYGPEQAEIFKHGQLAKAQEKLTEAKGQVTKELAERETQGAAETFARAAAQHAKGRYPLWGSKDFAQAMAGYGSYIDAAGLPAHASSWQQYADTLYAQNPRVQTDARTRLETDRQAQIDRLAQEKAEALDKQRLEEAARNRRTNPFGSTPAVQTGIAVPTADDSQPKTFAEFEQRLKRRVVHGAR